jgi:hypothetical protein
VADDRQSGAREVAHRASCRQVSRRVGNASSRRIPGRICRGYDGLTATGVRGRGESGVAACVRAVWPARLPGRGVGSGCVCG